MLGRSRSHPLYPHAVACTDWSRSVSALLRWRDDELCHPAGGRPRGVGGGPARARVVPWHGPTIRESLKAKRITSQGFGSASYWVNGTSACPATWVAALESATLQNNLRFLTLLPFAGALSELHLPRLRRAWCPACLEEQRNAGDAIHEFLAWGLRIMKACVRHHTPLEKVVHTALDP